MVDTFKYLFQRSIQIMMDIKITYGKISIFAEIKVVLLWVSVELKTIEFSVCNATPPPKKKQTLGREMV